MKTDKLKISLKNTPNVLLLGNGINRAFNFASWDELISSIKTKDLTIEEEKALKNVPYPLQPVILTDDNVGAKMKEIAPDLGGTSSTARRGGTVEGVCKTSV